MTCACCGETKKTGGDPGWAEVHAELADLHVRKSATYGRDTDRFANFTEVGQATGQPPEFYIAERMLEKLTRALNQMRAGDSFAVREWPDLASLAICAEAIRRRR